jgi:lipid II:glycine glycyltransferase (peptidoglycan interpeptide bridge formation enzyme)
MPVTTRILKKEDRSLWDQYVQKFNCVHPLNAFGWGQVRKVDGWDPTYLVAERNSSVAGCLMILSKKIPGIPFSILYSPRGPVMDPTDSTVLESLVSQVRIIARVKKAIFMRVDPNLEEHVFEKVKGSYEKLGFQHLHNRWNFWNSPRDVYRINLTPYANQDELFNSIDRDARRCVRKAQREGVTIEPASDLPDLKRFYEIFSSFSVSKNFLSRGYEYQRSLWDQYISRGNGKLFLAKYRNETIGGLICIMFAGKCLAMHMGTPYEYHKLHTYYAYVWESIKWAKENGCSWYSFRGVGTTPSQEYFKRKFRPEVISLAGYLDLPFKSNLYRAFHFMEFSVLPRAWPYLVKSRQLIHSFGKNDKDD